jgi:hypothetical protein
MAISALEIMSVTVMIRKKFCSDFTQSYSFGTQINEVISQDLKVDQAKQKLAQYKQNG